MPEATEDKIVLPSSEEYLTGKPDDEVVLPTQDEMAGKPQPSLGRQRISRAEAAVIRSERTGENLFQAYASNFMEGTAEEKAGAEADAAISAEQQKISEATSQMIGEAPSPEEGLEVAMAAQDVKSETDNLRYEDVDVKSSRMFVRSLQTQRTDPAYVKQQEVLSINAKYLSDRAETEIGSFGQKFTEYSGMVALALLGAPETKGLVSLGINPANAEEQIKDMIEGYHLLPPDVQAEQFPLMVDKFVDAFDNEVLGIAFATKFLDPSGEFDTSEFSRFWVGLSTADIAGMLYGLGKLAKTIKVGSTVVRTGARLNNIEKAAEANLGAVLDETGEVAQGMGYDNRINAVNDALPGMHHIDPTSTPNVASRTGDNLEAHHDAAWNKHVGEVIDKVITKDDQVVIGAFKSEEMMELANEAESPLRKAIYGEANARGLDVLDFKPLSGTDKGLTYELLVKKRGEAVDLGVADEALDLSTESKAMALSIQRKLVSKRLTDNLQILKNEKRLAEAARRMFPDVENSIERTRAALNNQVLEFKDLLDEYDTNLAGLTLTSDEVTRLGQMGTGIRYNKADEGAYLETKTITYTLDDIDGTLKIEGAGIKSPIGTSVRSPKSTAPTEEVAELVNHAIIYDGISAKVAHQLTNLHKEALAPLGNILSKQRRISEQRIDAVLRAGDEFTVKDIEVGKEWTPDELRAGISVVDRKTGAELDPIKLDPTEIEVYYRLRSMYDQLYRIKDAGVRRELELRGFKNIRIPFRKTESADEVAAKMEATPKAPEGGKGEATKLAPRTLTDGVSEKNVGQPLDTPAKARSIIDDSESIYFGDQDAVKMKHELNFDYLYEQGYKAVRLHEKSLFEHGGKRFEFVIVKTDDIGQLPYQVLHRKAGYVPRVYEKGLYFVKTFDEKGKFIKTHRQFDNAKEAELYAEAEMAAARVNGQFLDMKVLEDRQMNQMDLLMESVGGSGGLYNSPRAVQAVPFGLPGSEAANKALRLNSHQALAQMINHVSVHYPRNEWRLAMEQKLKNSIEKMTGVEYKGIYEPISGTGEQAKNAELMRKNMLTWLHVTDPAEKNWQYLQTRLYEWAIDSGDYRDFRKDAGLFGNARVGVGKGAWWLRSKDPATAIRAQAFHAMLGWFNPVQIWVQAQGFSLAASMAGKRAPKILADQFLLRGIYNLDNTEALAQTAKRAKMDVEDMVAMRDAYRKSGLQEGIDTTADYVAAESGWGHSISGFKEMADKGLFGYRAGEGFNRRFSFLTSMDEYLRVNKMKARDLTNDDIVAITTRANDFMLNLGRANRADWQTGWTSVPTQFMQVNTKMIETLLGKQFTFNEKLRILIGQLALYGTAGLPAGTFINNMVSGSARAYGIQENEEGLAGVAGEMLDQGSWGVLFNSFLGMDVTVAKRGAILSGVEDTLLNLFFRDAAISDVILGAGGSYVDRVLSGSRDIASMSLARLSNPRSFSEADVYRVLHNIGSITSSMNNAEKAWVMDRLGQIRTTKGTLIAEGDFTFMEKLGQAIGLTPKEVTNYYTLLGNNALKGREKSKVVARITDLYVRYATIYNSGEEPTAQQVEDMQLEIAFWLNSYDEYGKADIMKAVEKKLLDEPGETKAFRTYLKNHSNVTTESLLEQASRARIRDPEGI